MSTNGELYSICIQLKLVYSAIFRAVTTLSKLSHLLSPLSLVAPPTAVCYMPLCRRSFLQSNRQCADYSLCRTVQSQTADSRPSACQNLRGYNHKSSFLLQICKNICTYQKKIVILQRILSILYLRFEHFVL